MVLSLDNLINLLKSSANPNDTLPSEALWIKLAPCPKARTKYEETAKTVDYRTPDGNTLVQIHVDQQEAILSIEIFP
jgi:hypothetical protein